IFKSRRRHTRLVSDWSSDVCSSDLWINNPASSAMSNHLPGTGPMQKRKEFQIGRASCRGRGWISVVAVSLKKNKRDFAAPGDTGDPAGGGRRRVCCCVDV